MGNEDGLYSYRGKLLRDMTREELIAALAETARQMDRQYKRHIEDIEYLGSIGQRPSFNPLIEWRRKC